MVNLNCHQTDDERKECEGMRAERRDARAPAAWRRHRPRYAGCALRESIFAVLGLCGHAAAGPGANSGAQAGGSGAPECAAVRLCRGRFGKGGQALHLAGTE